MLAVLHNSIHLERIGDQSVTVAKLTKLSADLETRHDLVEGLGEMGDRASTWSAVALDSFATRDVLQARELVDLDELIDRTYRRVVDQVLQMAARQASEWGMRMIVVARCIERIGDNAVDIGEQTAFVVTGEYAAVHRCVPLIPHSFTQRKQVAGLPSRSDLRAAVTGTAGRLRSRGRVHTSSRRRGCNAMKKSLAAGLALVALVVATVVATGATAAPSTTQAGSLTGAGASFPFPLISRWIPEVAKSYDVDIAYSPTGSGAGIAAITARTVDFGASDAPLVVDARWKPARAAS